MQPLLASHKPRAHEDASLGRLGETQRGSEDKGLSQTLGPKVRGGISIKEGDDKGDIERGDFLMPLASISSATEWFRVTTKHEGNFISRGQGEPRVAGIIEEVSNTFYRFVLSCFSLNNKNLLRKFMRQSSRHILNKKFIITL
jgi:hypothetical protein